MVFVFKVTMRRRNSVEDTIKGKYIFFPTKKRHIILYNNMPFYISNTDVY